jgi:hypothetical protein
MCRRWPFSSRPQLVRFAAANFRAPLGSGLSSSPPSSSLSMSAHGTKRDILSRARSRQGRKPASARREPPPHPFRAACVYSRNGRPVPKPNRPRDWARQGYGGPAAACGRNIASASRKGTSGAWDSSLTVGPTCPRRLGFSECPRRRLRARRGRLRANPRRATGSHTRHASVAPGPNRFTGLTSTERPSVRTTSASCSHHSYSREIVIPDQNVSNQTI